MKRIKNLTKVVAYLKTDEVQDCYKNFKWTIPGNLSQIVGKKTGEEILNKNGVERNHTFFEKMHRHHNNQRSNAGKKEICLWVIRKWGGIANVHDDIFNVANDNYLKLENAEDVPLNRIASWSKYLTIINPKKYAIYDTRIAYCLNTLIIAFDLGLEYFPMPAGGRNKKINSINMDTVINIVELLKSNKKVDDLFAEKNMTKNFGQEYYRYLSFLKIINEELFKRDRPVRLYRAESLLFSISVDLMPDLLINTLRKKFANG